VDATPLLLLLITSFSKHKVAKNRCQIRALPGW
jgi:hypothetical protein